MAIIRITDLKLCAIIGINDWEREKKQDIIINMTIEFDALKSSRSDNIDDTVDYKAITKRIIKEVESSKFYLLEKLCQRILDIIIDHPLVTKASVRIDKPGALRFATSVSVELQKNRLTNTAIIGLGSNIAPKINIKKAKKVISGQFHVEKESKFIQTKPIGYVKQDNFINGCLLINTELSLEQLKQILKDLEKKLGRKASKIKYGPRTIDLDIVVFNGWIIDQDFYERDFLKTAVLELLPNIKC